MNTNLTGEVGWPEPEDDAPRVATPPSDKTYVQLKGTAILHLIFRRQPRQHATAGGRQVPLFQ